MARFFLRIPPPTSVDLRSDVDYVSNQKPYSSCTASAGCSCMEIMYKHHTSVPIEFSRMFLYYCERVLEGVLDEDVGARAVTIGQTLQQYGVCKEELWPYKTGRVFISPSQAAFDQAAQYRILSYAELRGDPLSAIKANLHNNIPILLSLIITNSFRKLTGDWKTHTWDTAITRKNGVLGGHEVAIVGYDDASGRLLIENSWGREWGDGGFGGIQYAAIDSPLFGALWVLQPNFTTVS